MNSPSDARLAIVEHFDQLQRSTQVQQWVKIRDQHLAGALRQDFYHPRWGVVSAYNDNGSWSVEVSAHDPQIAARPSGNATEDLEKIVMALQNIFDGPGRTWSTKVRQDTLDKIAQSPIFKQTLPQLLNLLSFHIRTTDLSAVDSTQDSQYQQVVITSQAFGPSVAQFAVSHAGQLSHLTPESGLEHDLQTQSLFTNKSSIAYDQLIDQLIAAGLQYNHQQCATCGHDWEKMCASKGIVVNQPPTPKALHDFVAMVYPMASQNRWGMAPSYVTDNLDAITQSPQWEWAIKHVIKNCKVECEEAPSNQLSECLVFFNGPEEVLPLLQLELAGNCSYLDFDSEEAQEISEDGDILVALADHPTWTVQDMLDDLSKLGLSVPSAKAAVQPPAAAPVAAPGNAAPINMLPPNGLSLQDEDEDDEDYDDEDGHHYRDEASQAISQGKAYRVEQLIASGWTPADGGHSVLTTAVSLNSGEAWRTLLSSHLNLSIPDELSHTLVGTGPEPPYSYDGFIKPLLNDRISSMSPQGLAAVVAWQMRVPPGKVVARQQQFIRQQLMSNLSSQDYNDVLILASLQESKGWLVKPWAQDLSNALATDPRGAQYLVNQAVHHAMENGSYASIKEIVKSSQIKPSMINLGGQSLLDAVLALENPKSSTPIPTTLAGARAQIMAMMSMKNMMGGFGGGSSQASINQRKMFVQSIKMLENQIAAKQKSAPKV